VAIDGTTGEKIWTFEKAAIYSTAFYYFTSTCAPPLTGDTNGDSLNEIITINWDRIYAINKSAIATYTQSLT
jgi:hypothetical protein